MLNNHNNLKFTRFSCCPCWFGVSFVVVIVAFQKRPEEGTWKQDLQPTTSEKSKLETTKKPLEKTLLEYLRNHSSCILITESIPLL